MDQQVEPPKKLENDLELNTVPKVRMPTSC